MNIKCFILLITSLIEVISAKINIDITTKLNSSDVAVTYSGIDVKVVTNQEISQFKISNKNLKDAVKTHYGKRPSSVFLKSPTPWGDLFKKHHWEQVSRVLSVKSTKVKISNTKPVIVLSHDFDNLSNNTVKVNTGISQTVENTVSSSWSHTEDFTASQDVEYKVDVIFAKLRGITGFSYTSTWGKTYEKGETVLIGATSAVETELKPNQSVTAILSATRGFLEIEVVYVATLRGNLAVNYRTAYKGHHFWGPPISSILASGGL